MVSGIGEAQHLKEHGIDVVADLPGVGKNLQDHLQARLVFKCNEPTLNDEVRSLLNQARIALKYALFRAGPMTMAASLATGFLRTGDHVDTPDIQFHVQPWSADSPGEGVHPFSAFTMSVCQLRPESRGEIRLASPDASVYPKIHPNYLSTETDRRTIVAGINIARRIAQLSDLLSLEQTSKVSLEEQIAQLRSSLNAAEGERDRIKGLYDSQNGNSQGQISDLTGKLDSEKQVSLRALAQVELLNQQIAALRRQLGAVEQALEASEKKDTESQTRIRELGERLNVALAQRVQELSRYRSDFFGKLRDILGNRPDIRIVGDRFVLQSEVFFDTGQAVLKPEGRAELDKIAAVLLEVSKQIPPEIAWVLRVDGHTDVRPIAGGRTNWDLSASRAIAVVQYLIGKGLPPQRLVAAGFGEFQPIDPGTTEEAYSRNRRIELKLTER